MGVFMIPTTFVIFAKKKTVWGRDKPAQYSGTDRRYQWLRRERPAPPSIVAPGAGRWCGPRWTGPPPPPPRAGYVGKNLGLCQYYHWDFIMDRLILGAMPINPRPRPAASPAPPPPGRPSPREWVRQPVATSQTEPC